MAKINKVVAFQSTDGQLFTDKALYLAHQRNINLRDGVKQVAQRINGDYRYHNDYFGYNAFVLDSDSLTDFLLENADDLMLVLQGVALPEPVAQAVEAPAPEQPSDELPQIV